MERLAINVDAGERGFGDALDLGFLPYVDELNIALGGHAGEVAWSQELAGRARAEGKLVNLHPGYPDRANFGRIVVDLPEVELRSVLSRQREVLLDVDSCKFHGALYNQAMVNGELAELLVDWAKGEGIDQLLAMPGSELERVAVEEGLRVRSEAFLDRAYVKKGARLVLADRSLDGAVFEEVESCLGQYESLLVKGEVFLLSGEMGKVSAETVCLHGDGKVGLSVARAIAETGFTAKARRG